MQSLIKTASNENLSARELKVMLKEITNSNLGIPLKARTVCQDLILAENPLRLYAITWPFLSPENTPEWMLLLILCRVPSRSKIKMVLPEGIRLSVSDTTGISVQKTFHRNRCDSYLYVLIAGSDNEEFVSTITLANGTALILPPFSFYSDN